MSEISIPGDPGGISRLASQLSAAADHVEDVHGRLAGEGAAGAWSGRAATAFHSSVHKLPAELGKVVEGFRHGARSLSSFASILAELQRKAGWYSRQIETAHQEQAEAEARRDQAQNDLNAAKLRHDAATDPVSLSTARDAVTYAEGRVSQTASHLEESVSRVVKLEAASRVLHDEYNSAVDACCGALDSARHSGSHSILGSIGHFVKGVSGAIGHEAGVIWHGAEDLAEGVENWGEKSWRDLGKFGHDFLAGELSWDDARAVLTDAKPALEVVGLVATAAFVVMSGGAGAPLLVAEIADGTTLLTAADDIAIGTGDSVEVLSGNTKYKKYLLEDGTDLVADAVSVHGVGTADSAVAKAQRDISLSDKAANDMERAAKTGTYQFKSAATRYRNQMTTFSSRLNDAVKDEVRDELIKETGKGIDDSFTVSQCPPPAVAHEIALPEFAAAS